MYEYEHYIVSRGEAWVQYLVEQIERTSGIRVSIEAPLPLKERWNTAMARPLPHNYVAH